MSNNGNNGNKNFNPPGKPTSSTTNQNQAQQIYNMSTVTYPTLANFNPASSSNPVRPSMNANPNSNNTNNGNSKFSVANLPNLINPAKLASSLVPSQLAGTSHKPIQPSFKNNPETDLLVKSIRENNGLDNVIKLEPNSVNETTKLLTKRKLQDLLVKVDPMERLDPDAEEVLLEIGDEFIESVCAAACKLAKHRKSNTLQVKDVQLHLERNWNLRIPGFSSDEVRTIRKLNLPSAQNSKLLAIHQAKLNKKIVANQPTQPQSLELQINSPAITQNKANTPGQLKSVNTPNTPALDSNKQ